jgi:hypothetical protein
MGTIITIVVIAIVIAISSSSDKNKGANSSVQRTKKGFFIGINNVTMNSPEAQKAFDWYKKVLVDENKRSYEVLRDVNLRREWHQIDKIVNSLPEESKDLGYLLGFNLFGGADDRGFILNPNEEALFRTNSVELQTIQKLCTNVSYSGFRYTSGNFRMGNMTLYPHNVEGLKHFADGEIMITNQRIIFRGDMKSKTIPINSIIGIENFGHDGVIIFLNNRVNPIVIRFLADKQFFYNEVHDISVFNNDLNDFWYHINKIFYRRLVPQDVQDARKDLDEINFNLARKTMIMEGLEEEPKG